LQSFKTNRIHIDLFNRGEKIGQANITAQVLSQAAPAASSVARCPFSSTTVPPTAKVTP
jgi:hypothetical protein